MMALISAEPSDTLSLGMPQASSTQLVSDSIVSLMFDLSSPFPNPGPFVGITEDQYLQEANQGPSRVWVSELDGEL